jgi:hypothetical protein
MRKLYHLNLLFIILMVLFTQIVVTFEMSTARRHCDMKYLVFP